MLDLFEYLLKWFNTHISDILNSFSNFIGVLETEQVFSSGDEEVTVATATLKSDKHWQK